MLKAFLGTCDPEKRGRLEKFLNPEALNQLQEIQNPPKDFSMDTFANGNILEKVHWSWFLPTLKSYSEIEQKLFLAALNPYAAKNLAKVLTLSSNGQEITEIGRSFLRKLLLDSLLGSMSDLLPVSCLPHSSLDKLLHLSKKELTHLIEKLAIFDLALELKQIVETKTLKKIYSLLTEEEKKILKLANTQKEHHHFGKMGLERWDGSEETLRKLMHKRGLNRLGVGLSGQDPDFIWYVCHRLDIGRGSALHKQCTEESVTGASEAIMKQIEDLL